MLAVTGLVVAAGWFGFVEYPASRERVAAVDALNAGISVANVDIETLDQRRRSLADALGDVDRSRVAPDARAGFERVVDTAEADLARAGRLLEAASTLSQTTGMTPAEFERRGKPASDQLAQQKQELSAAGAALADVEAALARLERLRSMPSEISLLHAEATELANDARVDARISTLRDDAIAALRRGEVDEAESAANEIRSLVETLSLEYRVSIVSEPGERTGVIREPPNNRSASNYYLIVEAVDRDNRPVQVAIRSEEDNTVRRVSRWGVRVSEALFETVRRDKQDDGIVQNRAFGQKARGDLDVTYSRPTQGGAITRW